MAAEEAQVSAPAANGAGHHTEIIATELPTDTDVAQNGAQTKMSAAEKRRQRKKKNKQTKQAERSDCLAFAVMLRGFVVYTKEVWYAGLLNL